MTFISHVDRKTRSSRDVRSNNSMSIRRSLCHRNFLLDTSIDLITLISISDALAVFVISVASLASVISVTSLAFIVLANLVVFDVIFDVLSMFVLNALVFNAAFFKRCHVVWSSSWVLFESSCSFDSIERVEHSTLFDDSNWTWVSVRRSSSTRDRDARNLR
jgi:hypothetical protein